MAPMAISKNCKSSLNGFANLVLHVTLWFLSTESSCRHLMIYEAIYKELGSCALKNVPGLRLVLKVRHKLKKA